MGSWIEHLPERIVARRHRHVGGSFRSECRVDLQQRQVLRSLAPPGTDSLEVDDDLAAGLVVPRGMTGEVPLVGAERDAVGQVVAAWDQVVEEFVGAHEASLGLSRLGKGQVDDVRHLGAPCTCRSR